MARLNSKAAKRLRKAAEFNPTKHRDKPPFPGVAYMAAYPVFETYETACTGNAIVRGKWTKTQSVQKRLIRENGQPLCRRTLTGEVETYPVPVTKPARYDASTKKGVYRQLKRLHRLKVLTALGAIHA